MDNKQTEEYKKLILDWWLKKYCPQIVNYINTVVGFEELQPDALELRRKDLLFEYLDKSDSVILIYLVKEIPRFFIILYDAIYKEKK